MVIIRKLIVVALKVGIYTQNDFQEYVKIQNVTVFERPNLKVMFSLYFCSYIEIPIKQLKLIL